MICYIHELQEYGLECISGHDTLFRSAPDFLRLAEFKEHATAILAYDHIVAMKILHDAQRYDIQLPQQVSLMCFDGEYLCDIVKPALTTMAIPSHTMGELAAEPLLKQIKPPGKRSCCRRCQAFGGIDNNSLRDNNARRQKDNWRSSCSCCIIPSYKIYGNCQQMELKVEQHILALCRLFVLPTFLLAELHVVRGHRFWLRYDKVFNPQILSHYQEILK